jgi:hypothetical protein
VSGAVRSSFAPRRGPFAARAIPIVGLPCASTSYAHSEPDGSATDPAAVWGTPSPAMCSCSSPEHRSAGMPSARATAPSRPSTPSTQHWPSPPPRPLHRRRRVGARRRPVDGKRCRACKPSRGREAARPPAPRSMSCAHRTARLVAVRQCHGGPVIAEFESRLQGAAAAPRSPTGLAPSFVRHLGRHHITHTGHRKPGRPLIRPCERTAKGAGHTPA